MKSNAVVTLVTTPEWDALARVTLPSQRHYAARIGADFVILDKRIHAHPHYDKWQIYDLFDTYDRILYLDADMIVRQDCPNLFNCVPHDAVGGENELKSCPAQAQQLERFCERVGIGSLPCPFYINGGMFLASANHREVFRKPEVVVSDLPWPEQSHFNARLIGEKHKVFLLPSCFNDRHRQGDYLWRSYILHYSCMSHQARVDAATRDLASWQQICGTDALGETRSESRPQKIADHDYVSPTLQKINCDSFFPNLMIGNKSGCVRPYIRRNIPHHFYVDRRAPGVGFMSRDEVTLLYNTALQFHGLPALEIGCWLGWATCHLALAGLRLDVVDPILNRKDVHDSVTASLRAAGIRDSVNLIGDSSPGKIHELASVHGCKWSFFAIDGNNTDPHPLEDAKACEAHAATDAMIFFQNLSSPEVAMGLEYLRGRGWHTRIYQTMQIIGAAWRGSVKPVDHVPDPDVIWETPMHLQQIQS
jgi:hypothetical protein